MRTVLFMSSGVMVWVLHFAAIYGLTALACARGWQSMVAPSALAATALAAAASVAILVLGLRRRAEFEYWMAAGIAALALVAIVWEAIPVFMVPICP